MPEKPSAQDEAAFMQELLSGIDSSFFVNALSPDPSAKKRRIDAGEQAEHLITPTKARRNPLATPEPQKKKARRCTVSEEDDLTSLLEGAEDWDLDDMLSPVRKKPNLTVSLSSSQSSDQVVRCKVKSVEHCGTSKKIHVSTKSKSRLNTVVLRDDWLETDVHAGDTLNVVGVFSLDDEVVTISSKCNLLIQHPDFLVAATSVANALHCSRRPLLSLLVRSSSDTTRSLVWGNLLHEIMQHCFSTGRWDIASIDDFIDETIQKNLMELVRVNVGADEAKAEIKRRADGLRTFGKKFWGETPKPDAVLSNTREEKGTAARLAITQLHGVEEEIWAPRYGLKGKVDASLQVCIDECPEPERSGQRRLTPQHRTTSAVMPFEIKTGLAIAGMEHRAQTMLYSLLIAERYGSSSSDLAASSYASSRGAGGLLFYTQSEDLVRVPSGWNELRGLIMARNELASYLARSRREVEVTMRTGSQKNVNQIKSVLPPTVDQSRLCERCYASDACMLYRKAVENIEDDCSPIADLYELKTGRLSREQLDFFKKWENLITLEEQDATRFRSALWTMNADDREKAGKCLANMVLDATLPGQDAAGDTRFHRHTYRFVRQAAFGRASTSPSLLHGNITAGDPIVISVMNDPRLIALARGFILDLTSQAIIVGVDYSLSPDLIRSRNSRYRSATELLFRIDKDDLMSGLGRVRDNLAQLFYVSGSHRLLGYVVDLKPPTFEAELNTAVHYPEDMNESQVHALNHSLRANDYALILGMPGTGKTTTIAYTISTMVAMGKTVLLTSYTHSAVDTILLKLKNIAQYDVLRLGNKDKVHPGVQAFTLDAQEPAESVEELERRLLRPQVVATTALSTDHALFSRRRFDYCIVDEASQITLPTCIGPLRFADKFILVGDHFQLPPLVKSREARKAGFDVSLFRRLSDAHPHAVVDLTYQYRMNEDIMLLSNRLIYSDRLKCGSPEVAKRSLRMLHPRKFSCPCVSKTPECWLNKIMDENCKAVFVDTDALPAHDSRVGDLIQNETEASLVQQLTLALLKGAVREEQIGIISLYRQQIKLLSNLLQGHEGIEILTADKSQGRDKDCIIISLVRANKDNQIGDLLKDWRRVNVAFTRARAKLVIFGSRNTLKASPLLQDFFSLMEERGWVLALPPGADAVHVEEDDDSARKNDMQMPKVLSTKTSTKQENLVQSKKTKQASITTGLLRSRPILRDVLNDAKRQS